MSKAKKYFEETQEFPTRVGMVTRHRVVEILGDEPIPSGAVEHAGPAHEWNDKPADEVAS